MKYLSIKHFDEYQHYKRKDWSPPWIKLYNRLLDDYDFLALSEVAQRHLICLWLLASRHNNRIPNDLVHITRAIHAKSAVDLESLIVAGFVIPTDEPPVRKRKPRKRKQQQTNSRTILESSYKKSTPEKRREEKKQPVGGWVARFGEARIKYRGGDPGYGEIGKSLKTVVDREGEDKIYPPWCVFLQSDKAGFGPAWFAKNIVDFYPKPTLSAETPAQRQFRKRGYVT